MLGFFRGSLTWWAQKRAQFQLKMGVQLRKKSVARIPYPSEETGGTDYAEETKRCNAIYGCTSQS